MSDIINPTAELDEAKKEPVTARQEYFQKLQLPAEIKAIARKFPTY